MAIFFPHPWASCLPTICYQHFPWFSVCKTLCILPFHCGCLCDHPLQVLCVARARQIGHWADTCAWCLTMGRTSPTQLHAVPPPHLQDKAPHCLVSPVVSLILRVSLGDIFTEPEACAPWTTTTKGGDNRARRMPRQGSCYLICTHPRSPAPCPTVTSVCETGVLAGTVTGLFQPHPRPTAQLPHRTTRWDVEEDHLSKKMRTDLFRGFFW